MILAVAGEWIALWSVVSVSILAASWRPWHRFRERRHLQKRLRSIHP